MLTYTLRRLLLSVPTLLFISLTIFLLLQLAPNDPMANVPLTVPPEVKQKMREALGLGQAWYIQYWKWLVQFFWIEPLVFIDWLTGTSFAEGKFRAISWQTRGPVMDLVIQSLPQTLWVVGVAYVVAVIIAIPIGVYSAYRQYSIFDNAGTFVSMIGFSVPPFFTGPLLIFIFAVQLSWFPSTYNTIHEVNDWNSFLVQLSQMFLPVMVLALQITAQLNRFMRASMLDNLLQDYVRTARAKGLKERTVVLSHVLRNSMIPVVTVIALQIPNIFGGAIITENVFQVNGLGYQLLIALQSNDMPTVMTFTFIFAILIVLFNIVADVLYGLLDPRIRYD
jgi:peptide/nickel transport system permease protein